MARVCIVVPAYNAQAHLAQTLDSVARQTCRDWELVVVDDGSTDGTAAIAEAFAQSITPQGPPVRVIRQANAGLSAARNRGIASSGSELIALLDSDDVWHPQKLERQLAALQARPTADFCFTGFAWWSGEDPADWLTIRFDGGPAIDESLSGWIYHRLILENHALPSSWLVRRSAWQRLGPLRCEDQKTDDWEYIVRASRDHVFVALKEDLVLYRQVAGSLSRRLTPENGGELMRERLIGRYGLASPDGTPVDRQALQQQRYQGWRHFADAHCARGELGLGLRTFATLLRRGPRRGHTLLSLGMALRRRLFPRPEGDA